MYSPWPSLSITNEKSFINLSFKNKLKPLKVNLASRLVAKIGDINRFNSYKAIISFVGNDPKIYQSGDDLGLHKK